MHFKYQGKNKVGESVSGKVSARTKEDAIETISHQGILPISIEEYSPFSKTFIREADSKVSSKQVYMFSRQLSSLIKSGVSILRALEVVGEQASNPRFVDILCSIRQGIKEGRNFSDCLSDYPRIFSSFYVAMVSVGEEGGNLREILAALATYQKKQQQIKSSVRTALAYPVFMGIVGLMTVIFILTFVMPKITVLFINIGQSLPLPTKILMGVSHAIRSGWFIFIPLGALIVFSLIRWMQSKKGKYIVDDLKLRIPIVKSLVLKVELGRFCRTLELLLGSGVSLLRAINVAAPTLGNELIRTEILKSCDGLSSGESLANSFAQCRYVTPMMISLVKIGEESGLLEETLHDVADTYEQETDEAVQTFTTVLEPVMILLVGAIVGMVIIAMLLPIFQMDLIAS